MFETTAAPGGGRAFPETGCSVEGIFLDFFNRYGVEICGLPITERLVENGLPTQYFQRLALEEAAGQVRVKPLGVEVLARRGGYATRATTGADTVLASPPFALPVLVSRLPRHATLRYESRPLEQITHLVIHHTGVAAEVGPEVIAGYHVTDLNWPGIGYHFVVYPDGRIVQTNALTTVAYHARQFNAMGVGIALLGDFESAPPAQDQLDATAALCVWLRRGLRLPVDAIQGHRELVNVTCPGDQWLLGAAWKYDLIYRVQREMGEALGVPGAERPAVSTDGAGDLDGLPVEATVVTTPFVGTADSEVTAEEVSLAEPPVPQWPFGAADVEAKEVTPTGDAERPAPPAPAQPVDAPPYPSATDRPAS